MTPLDRGMRRVGPVAITLALILLSVLPWPLPGATPVAPQPALAAVYYWTMHRPEAMPPLAVFGLGLAQDMLVGGPPGLSALVLLLVQGMIAGQRRQFARSPFVVGWWGFAVAAAGAGAASWLLACLYYVTVLGPQPLFVQYLLNLCLYPVLSWIFGMMQGRIPRPA